MTAPAKARLAAKAPTKAAGGGAKGKRPAARRSMPPASTPDVAPPVALASEPAVRLLALSLLDDHPDNPPGRSQVDDEGLVASMRAVGVLQPLLVRPGQAGRFTIVAGHRRRAAAVAAGITEVLCQVSGLAGADVDVAMAAENGRRKGLTALEEAALFERLRSRDKLSQRDIADRTGCHQSHVSRLLSLLKLPDTARADVALERVAVADAAQLAQYTGHPEAFAAGWKELTTGYGGVKHAVSRAQGMVDAAQLRAKLQADGVPLTLLAPTYDGIPRVSYYVGLQEAKHCGLDCHVVHVDDRAQRTWGCTRPAEHTTARGSGGSDAKAREETRERKKAIKARVQAAAKLEAWPVAAADAAAVLARALANRAGHSECMTLAVAWMQANGAYGVDMSGEPYTVEKQILQHGDDRLVVRYGCALALAADEQRTRDQHTTWGRVQALYLHRLALLAGYEPSAWERSRLRTQAGIADVEAFLAADDPTPHLPGQPTLHSALGTEPPGQLVQDLEPAGDLL